MSPKFKIGDRVKGYCAGEIIFHVEEIKIRKDEVLYSSSNSALEFRESDLELYLYPKPKFKIGQKLMNVNDSRVYFEVNKIEITEDNEIFYRGKSSPWFHVYPEKDLEPYREKVKEYKYAYSSYFYRTPRITEKYFTDDDHFKFCIGVDKDFQRLDFTVREVFK